MPATNKSPRAAAGQDTDLVFRRLEGTKHINQGKCEHRISTWESLGHSDPPGCLVGGQLVEKVAHLQENTFTLQLLVAKWMGRTLETAWRMNSTSRYWKMWRRSSLGRPSKRRSEQSSTSIIDSDDPSLLKICGVL